MLIKYWIYLLVAIIAEVIATTALKASEGFTKPAASAIVVVGYGVAFFLISLSVKTIPLGIAYAVWSGLGIIFISAIAWFLYGQKLDFWGVVGIGLILSGGVVLRLLSKSVVE